MNASHPQEAVSTTVRAPRMHVVTLALVLAAGVLLVLLSGCGGGGGAGAEEAAGPEDTMPPTVQAISPADGTSNVPRTETIEIVFSEPMERASTQAAFTIWPPVAGGFRWSADDTVLTFSADTYLPDDAEMEVTIADTATDLAGLTLAAGAGTFFVTTVDWAPLVDASIPEHTEVDVWVGIAPRLVFTEAMDPLTTAAALSVLPETEGTISFSADGTEMTFTPDVWLDPMTTYQFTLSADATDTTGNPIPGPFVFQFTTGPGI